jgi:hypothetical protein
MLPYKHTFNDVHRQSYFNYRISVNWLFRFTTESACMLAGINHRLLRRSEEALNQVTEHYLNVRTRKFGAYIVLSDLGRKSDALSRTFCNTSNQGVRTGLHIYIISPSISFVSSVNYLNTVLCVFTAPILLCFVSTASEQPLYPTRTRYSCIVNNLTTSVKFISTCNNPPALHHLTRP